MFCCNEECTESIPIAKLPTFAKSIYMYSVYGPSSVLNFMNYGIFFRI